MIVDIFRNWLLPPKIFRLLIILFNYYIRRITQEEKEIVSKNAVFKDKFKGKRCFIIGNGPSLNNVDISGLNGEITIVMNRFDCHPILEKWQPTFYCAADPPDRYSSEGKELIEFVGKKIFPDGYFFPLSMKSILESSNNFPQEKTFYLDMRENLEDWNINKYKIDLTKKTAGVQTTAILGIIIAIYAGCDKIYLLGMDFSWLAYQKITQMAHFYENKNVDDEENIENTWKYKQNIEAVLNMCKQYEVLHLYAKRNGVSIINLTEDSFLDEFPRGKFKDVL